MNLKILIELFLCANFLTVLKCNKNCLACSTLSEAQESGDSFGLNSAATVLAMCITIVERSEDNIFRYLKSWKHKFHSMLNRIQSKVWAQE